MTNYFFFRAARVLPVLLMLVVVAANIFSGCSESPTKPSDNPVDTTGKDTSKPTPELSLTISKGNGWKFTQTPVVLYDTAFHIIDINIETDSPAVAGKPNLFALQFYVAKLEVMTNAALPTDSTAFLIFITGDKRYTAQVNWGRVFFSITSLDLARQTISLTCSAKLIEINSSGDDSVRCDLTLKNVPLRIVPKGSPSFICEVNDLPWPGNLNIYSYTGTPFHTFIYNRESAFYTSFETDNNVHGQPDEFSLYIIPTIPVTGTYPLKDKSIVGEAVANFVFYREDIVTDNQMHYFQSDPADPGVLTISRYDPVSREFDATFQYKAIEIYTTSDPKSFTVSGELKNWRWQRIVSPQ